MASVGLQDGVKNLSDAKRSIQVNYVKMKLFNGRDHLVEVGFLALD